MATLTSTGAVNLTSSTNWSPAQVPAAGDDLIIGAHTLTADADRVLNSITTTSGSSRITISGNRTITATTWDLSGDGLFNPIASQTVNLFGKFTINNTSSTSLGFLFQSISNSILKLSTIGENPSSILFEPKTASAGLRLFNGAVATTNLTTIGRINFSNSATGILFNAATDVFSSWTHNSVGENYVYGSFVCQRFNGSVSLLLNISGNFHYQNPDTPSNTFAHWQVTGNNNSIFTGNHSIDLLPGQAAIGMLNLLSAFTGSVTIVGKWTSTFNFNAINVNAGSLLYRNQSITIGPTEQTVITAAAAAMINLEGLQALVSGNLLFTLATTTSVIVNSGTLLSCTSDGLALAGIVQAPLRSKIVKLPNVVPTLPATQDVSVGTTYGYSGSEIIGTGLIVDPAIISSAVLAAQMATLQRNPAFVIERTLEDERPLNFSWPNSTDTVQGQVSIDNGSYVAVAGTIAYFRSENGKYYFTLTYNAADRPVAEGTARYRFYSGSHGVYATLRTVKAIPTVDEIVTETTESIERQDGMASEILDVVSQLGYTAASSVVRPLDDTNPVRFVFVAAGQTLTGTKSINSGAPVSVAGTISEVDLGLEGNWYQLAYDAADRPDVGEFVVYKFTDGVSDQSVLLTITAPLETTLENMPSEVWSNPERELTDIDLDPVLERLPTELVDGRMDATIDPDQFDEIISTIIGAAPGMGGTVKPITVMVAGQPSADAAVWVTTDQAGQVLVAGALSTDAFGMVEFMLDTGTYYAWVQKSGYNFDNPTEFAVADVDTTITGESIVPGSNLDDTDLITAVLRVRDQVGQPCVGAKVEVEVIGDPAIMDDKVLINTPNPVFTLGTGQATIRVYRGQSYLYRITYRRFPPVEITRTSPAAGDDFLVAVIVG